MNHHAIVLNSHKKLCDRTGKKSSKWSGNVFQSLGAAALKIAAAEEEVTVRSVNKFADFRLTTGNHNGTIMNIIEPNIKV